MEAPLRTSSRAGAVPTITVEASSGAREDPPAEEGDAMLYAKKQGRQDLKINEEINVAEGPSTTSHGECGSFHLGMQTSGCDDIRSMPFHMISYYTNNVYN